jgi:hypothetical protein
MGRSLSLWSSAAMRTISPAGRRSRRLASAEVTRPGRAELFGEALALCADAGLVGVAVLGVDGRKIHANASQHQNLDYDQLARKILAEAGPLDRAEDERFGERRRDELSPELSTAQAARLAARCQAPPG